MKLLSWNVNGIRAIATKGFFQWMQKESPDILCLQETKAHPNQLTEDFLKPQGYYSFWSSAEKKGYSGVAIYTKIKPISVTEGLGIAEFDSEGRTLIADFGDFPIRNQQSEMVCVGTPIPSPMSIPFHLHLAFQASDWEKNVTVRQPGSGSPNRPLKRMVGR